MFLTRSVGVWAEGTTEERGVRWLDVPLTFKPQEINRDDHWLFVEARMKPGVTLQQAQADMDRVTALIAKEYPASNQGWGASVEPLKNDFFPEREADDFLAVAGRGVVRSADRMHQRG